MVEILIYVSKPIKMKDLNIFDVLNFVVNRCQANMLLSCMQC